MGTRGLVVLKRGNKQMAYYNQMDSYPTGLGAELSRNLWRMRIGYTDSDIEEALRYWIMSRSPGNMRKPYQLPGDITKPNRNDIDYLMVEWIYVVDIPKKRWAIYKIVYPANFAFKVSEFKFSDNLSQSDLEAVEKLANKKFVKFISEDVSKKPVKVRGYERRVR